MLIPSYSLQHKGKKVVLVGGCFDILHKGHLVFLEAAKKQGDILVVALESDEFIRVHKKREPVHSQKDRALLLQSLKAVDEVIPLPYFSSYSDYEQLVQKIRPTIIAITENDPHHKEKEQQAQAIGASCIVVTPLVPGYSTTTILNN
ncbi:MAG: adenylyltransferase/cytidyltransferase family protein [Patescibacteria group bacterium]